MSDPVRTAASSLEATNSASADAGLAARLTLALRVGVIESWETDVATGEQVWSDHAETLFGFSPGTGMGAERLLALIHPEDREAVGRARRRLLEDVQPLDLEIRIVRPDGEERWLHVQAENLRDALGHPRRVVGVVHDVTERRRAEERLHAGEERLRQVIETTSVGILVAEHGEIVLRNRAIQRMLDLTDAELTVGDPIDLLFAPHDRDAARGAVAAVVRGDLGCYSSTGRLPRPDGSTMHVDVSCRAFSSASGSGAALYEVHDVTDRVELVRRLESSESRLRAIVHTVGEGILTIDTHGTIVSCNNGAARLFGSPEHELVGSRSLLLVADAYRAAEIARSQRYWRSRDPRAIDGTRELLCLRRDGSTFSAILAITEVRGIDEPLFTVVVRDLSQQRRAAEAVRQLSEERAVRAEERRSLLRRLLEAEEEGRRRVAIDIHDGPAQQLTGADMFLQTYRAKRGRGDGEEAERLLDRGTHHLRLALEETRRIMSDLRPPLLDDFGLVDALRASCVEAGEASDCLIEYRFVGEYHRLHPHTEIAMFRIAQEAVGNAIRHAGSLRILVTLVCTPTQTP